LTRSLEQAGRGVPRSGRLAGLSGQLWDECLAEMTEGQSERQALTPEEFSWDRYVGAARRRTAFVGRAWVDALSAADQGQAAAFVTTAYPWCAEAGQLRNDLRNTTGRETLDGGVRYSDLGEGKVTAVSGLLWQRADDVDRRWLRKHVWGRGRPSAEALVRVDRMVEHYAVISDVAVSTGRLVERIRAAIRTMDRPHARTVWDAWVTRQFEVGVHRAYGWGDASIPAFEAAVAGLRGSDGLENEDGGRS
jgi:geranylgeranyl pyrophosphate synthase